MRRYDYDLLTIGAGSGGVRVSRLAGAFGARVGVIETDRVGGTCVLRGCVPKKLLVTAAHYARDFADAKGYGWSVDGARFDWSALIAAKNDELGRRSARLRGLLRDAGVELIEGRGRLADAHTVEVAGRRLTAERIVIATGSWPDLPDLAGIEHAITSNEAFGLPTLPKSIAIVGAGYIAVEFAGIFNALGADVTQIVRGDTLLRRFDRDLGEALAKEMARKGVRLRTGTVVQEIEPGSGGLSVRLSGGDGAAGGDLPVDTVLYATGRKPNVAGLGLAEVGVALDPRTGAVKVDAYSRSSVDGIFAIGDVTDRKNLTTVALEEARCLIQTLFNNRPTAPEYDNIASAVFSMPAIGTVGLSEDEARRRFPGDIAIYRNRYRPLPNALAEREEQELVKVVVRKSDGRVLGCHMLGAQAPELIQGLAVAMKCKMTKADLDATIGVHPTSAEEFVTLRAPVPEADKPD